MAKLKELKRDVATKEKKVRFKKTGESLEEPTEVDMDEVEKIVKRMRDKYRAEGVEFEEVGGSLSELRGLIADGMSAKVEIQTVEDLREVKNKLVNFLAKIYLKLGGVLKPLTKTLTKLPEIEMVSFYLYSANMHYSSRQYIALSVAASTIMFLIALLISSAAFTLMDIAIGTRIIAIVGVSVMAFFITLIIALLIPKRRAIARGEAVSIELPFALRHMSTELKAGIGLYRTIQAVASADYGALSEEFARVIREVEEGTDTKDALKHLALRTQSKALRNALIHIVRALKTGGNLSSSMSDIAEDVSFNLRMAVREFGERMNFFGVVYIFGAIVMPIMIAILGSIRNSPIKESMTSFQMLPLTIPIMAAIYVVVMPFMLIVFLVFIKGSQPKV
jgi:flagellar protein FlaJ